MRAPNGEAGVIDVACEIGNAGLGLSPAAAHYVAISREIKRSSEAAG